MSVFIYKRVCQDMCSTGLILYQVIDNRYADVTRHQRERWGSRGQSRDSGPQLPPALPPRCRPLSDDGEGSVSGLCPGLVQCFLQMLVVRGSGRQHWVPELRLTSHHLHELCENHERALQLQVNGDEIIFFF